MKQMSRDPSARSKALRAERRADEKSGLGLITIKPLSSGASSGAATNALEGGTPGSGATSGTGKGKGFKKGGFRNAFGGDAETEADVETAAGGKAEAGAVGTAAKVDGGRTGEVVGVMEKIGGKTTESGRGIGHDNDYDYDYDDDESENDEEAYAAEGGRYDPLRPTGCGNGCSRGREEEVKVGE